MRNIETDSLKYVGNGFDNPQIRRIRRLKTETKTYQLASEIIKEREYSVKEIMNATWKQKEQ